MQLNVHINKDGISNDEIKWIREVLSDVTSAEMKSLCNGNRFSVQRGCSDDAIKVSFKMVSTFEEN